MFIFTAIFLWNKKNSTGPLKSEGAVIVMSQWLLPPTSKYQYYSFHFNCQKKNIAAEHYLKLCWVPQNFWFLKNRLILQWWNHRPTLGTYVYVLNKISFCINHHFWVGNFRMSSANTLFQHYQMNYPKCEHHIIYVCTYLWSDHSFLYILLYLRC